MGFNKVLCGNPAEVHTVKGNDLFPILNQEVALNEIFGPTIQGEGKSAGKEVMFLRTSGCNLACIWCDTPYTWNWEGTKFQHPEKFDPKKEVHKTKTSEIVAKLRELGPRVKSLVISGGEPLLQQKRLLETVEILRAHNYWIEVETNGTQVPDDEFVSFIDQINCSPKLSNSGPDNPLSKREVPKALEKLASLEKTTFKFVVTSEQDMVEILHLVQKYKMKNVYLMPEGRTKAEQESRQHEIEKISAEYGFTFSPRLHVLKWGTKRAV